MDTSIRSPLCGSCVSRYRAALAAGEIAGEAPECLTRLGLLRLTRSMPEPRAGQGQAAGEAAAGTPMSTAVYLPVPPSVAALELGRPIEEAIERHQADLDTLTLALSPLEALYQQEQLHQAGTERLFGRDTIGAALELALDACREEVLAAHPHGEQEDDGLAENLDHDLDLAARGVRQRILYSHAMRSHEPTLAYTERITRAGAEVRTVDEVFQRLIIFDRSVAFLPEPAAKGQQPCVVSIRLPGLVQYLAKMHEHVWERGKPVIWNTEHNRPPRLTDEIQTKILRLMVEGHTDRTISKRLGLSTRTIGTHIKRASALFGARSRAELGYRLSQADALDSHLATRTRELSSHVTPASAVMPR
ncbi:helix-turn-helix transcriptional regulator [Streptomyces sp. NPDC050704]|uniref:helix-turn-helix transcriptional regulator n=1 Tax=Streptomyces sp. NPDC050704 TaxID=3157219 RepID=UPI00344AAA8C